MAESFNYQNFDLIIEGSDEDRYRAQVVDSPGGSATAEFKIPFQPMELENFLLRIGRPRRGTRRVASPEMKAIEGFGRRLFETVFAGPVKECLNRSLTEIDVQDSRLRLRLRFKNAGQIAEYPWEFLYDPGNRCFLALSERTPLVRFLPLEQRIRPLTVTPPLHVLVMIASPSDLEPLDVKDEWKSLSEALTDLQSNGMVKLDLLADATLGALQSRLRQGDYHVLHFIGHGGFDDQQKDGLLMFEDEAGRSRPVYTLALGALLRDERSLRLVVLNACEGGRGSACDPFAGTAQSLIQQGVPAVIAMQFEVTDEAALTFSYEFYRAVADNYPVDAALAEARKAVFSRVSDVEWGTPVLYMRAPDGRIFDIAKRSDQDRTRQRAAALLAEAQEAATRKEWVVAAEKAQQVLALDSTNEAASTLLAHARRQQELAARYEAARKLCDERQWSEAAELLRALGGEHEEASALLATAERELARAQEQDERRARLATLRAEADAASARGNWSAEMRAFRAIVEADPSDKNATEGLAQAERRHWLETVYARGLRHWDAGHLREALEDLLRVRELDDDYSNVRQLIPKLEHELAARDQPPPVPMDTVKEVPRRRVSASLAIGGCLGTVTVIGLAAIALVQSGGGGSPSTAAVPVPNEVATGAVEAPSAPPTASRPPMSTSPSVRARPAPPVTAERPPARTPGVAPLPGAVTVDPAVRYRDELVATIRRSNEAEVLALSTHNTALLGSVFVGDALEKELQAVVALQAIGAVAYHELLGQQYHAFSVTPDEQRAVVRLTERWRGLWVFPALARCGALPPHDVPQTVTLERHSGRWMVASVEMSAESPEPQPVPCP
jgi:tetratricopeptide (TPR) repeat protein